MRVAAITNTLIKLGKPSDVCNAQLYMPSGGLSSSSSSFSPSYSSCSSVSDIDMSASSDHVKVGDLAVNSMEEILKLSEIQDKTRFLGHIPKIELIRGDAIKTIPKFVIDNPHVLISLLFLDFDLYEPTKVALEELVPRMPKGAVIAFDELDNPLWPGETQAMLEFFKDNKLRIQRIPFDPYIGYAIIE